MIFNADEVFKIAEQIEQNGVAFYERAAESFRGDEKSTLLRLADMERTHERVFSAMRRELSKTDQGLQAFDPEGDASRYLAAFAEGQIFDLNAGTEVGPRDSDRDILEMAIGLEKDSVVFYVAIRDAVPESLGKDRIERIIREEMDHIILLTDTLKALEDSP